MGHSVEHIVEVLLGDEQRASLEGQRTGEWSARLVSTGVGGACAVQLGRTVGQVTAVKGPRQSGER